MFGNTIGSGNIKKVAWPPSIKPKFHKNIPMSNHDSSVAMVLIFENTHKRFAVERSDSSS